MADRHKNRTRESEAERQRLRVIANSDIGPQILKALKRVNWDRRDAGERDPIAFVNSYCVGPGGFLETPPPLEMMGIIREMDAAVGDASVPYHIRIARGHGKTSYTKCVIKRVIAYGIRRFVIAVGANGDNAKEIIEDVYYGMIDNPHFVQDFPEIAIPLKAADGTYQRAANQTAFGAKTNPRKTAASIELPHVVDPSTGKPFPSSGAILNAVGFSSGARGKVKMTQRPDFVIFDDLQTDELAENEGRVLAAAQRVKKAFLGLAGHRKKIAAVMTSTPIAPNDLSEYFAKDKGWRTSTYRMVQTWPKCFHPPKDSGIFDHWEEYNDIFQREKLAGRVPHLAANRYYVAHRRAMDDGGKVLNPRNFDPKTEKSGLQHAMNLLFRDGADAFMCEYQMEPPKVEAAFEISAEMVLARVRKGAAPHSVPAGTVLTCAATDINPGYGLTTVVVCFDVFRTGFVTAYAVHKCHISDNLNDVEFNRRVYEELAATGREIAALGIPLDAWGIDAGGKQFQAVTQFVPMADALCGLPAVAMLGRAGRNWNPNVKSRIRNAKNDTVLCQDPQRRRWLAWNADSYKESAQKAWGTETGAVGGLSLFDGGVNHFKFAVQIANEKLIGKTQLRDVVDYKWQTKNPHDYGDGVAMCYALAGSKDLTGAGTATKTRRVRVGGIQPAQTDQTPQTTHRRVHIGHA